MRKGQGNVYDKWKISVVIVTQIFHNSQPRHGGDRYIFDVIISPLQKRTLASVASVLVASSIREILIGATSSGISYYLRDVYSICRCCWNGATYTNWNHLFCHKVSFLTAPDCRFRGVGQDMKPTYLYLWYPLFQAQWDICDQHNYLLKGHHLYSGTWN